MRNTEEGPRPFTDVFMHYKGEDFYSRYHGTLNDHEIKIECKMFEHRIKKEGK